MLNSDFTKHAIVDMLKYLYPRGATFDTILFELGIFEGCNVTEETLNILLQELQERDEIFIKNNLFLLK